MASDAGGELGYPVVAFDLDGTLVRGSSVLALLAQALGYGAAMEELERRFIAQEISNRDIADETGQWFSGHHPDALWEYLKQAPWIGGIDETLEVLISAGCNVLLCTITWRFVSESLQRRYGFHAVSGTEMGFNGELLSGRVSRYFVAEDKVRFVEDFCREHGFTPDQVAAVGDSRLDVPLFGRVGRSIALNATADARAAADFCLDTDDLTAVLKLLGAP